MLFILLLLFLFFAVVVIFGSIDLCQKAKGYFFCTATKVYESHSSAMSRPNESIPLTTPLPSYQQVYGSVPAASAPPRQQQQQQQQLPGGFARNRQHIDLAQILPEREIEARNNGGVEPERDEKPGIGDVPEEHLNVSWHNYYCIFPLANVLKGSFIVYSSLADGF